jgi:hypothetical protein
VLNIPAPAALHGEALEAEIAASLGRPVTVVLNPAGRTLDIVGADDADRPAVEETAAAHVPPPPPAAADDDLAARIQTVHDDPNVSAGVKKLTAALLGVDGEAAVAGRPTDSR